MSSAILGLEEQRCQAMLRNDIDALELLLDQRLVFTHATGGVENKIAYIARVREGRIVYRSIRWSDQVEISLGLYNVLLMGRMTVDVVVDGTDKRLENRVIEVWSGTDHIWKLLAFQSTPIK